jgi:hypothetical protein
MTLDPARRSALLATKLRALVDGRWDVGTEARPGGFPDGASLVDPAAGRTWVLVEDNAERRLGGALAVALRAGADELHLVVDGAAADAGPVLARRAACFDPAPRVWRTDDRDLVPVEAAPPATDPPPAPEAELYRPVLRVAGLDPVVEGGDLIGELRGLEVARVVVADGEARLEAGVGRFDREAGSMMFADLGETDSVARAVDIVARYRTPGAERHPLNTLVPERWLRSVVVADPTLVGAAELRPVGSAVPRRNLRDDGVATAVGTDLGGAPVVAVCSSAVDLDLVAAAVDDRLTHGPSARLLLVLAERDAAPITRDLAALVADGAEVVTVADDWRLRGAGAT